MKAIQKLVRDSKIMKESLYRNSIYLMASTFIMAVLGFFFWIINARLFTTEEVGLATTIISVMGIIVNLSIIGLNAGLIRYLPNSRRKNDKINTSFTVTALISIIVTSIFLLLINDFSPKLIFIRESVVLSFVFIFFMIIATWNSLFENIFTAFRDTKYILVKNTIFSALKLVLPFALVSLGAYGIFSSWMIAMIVGLAFSIFILVLKFNYRPKLVFYDSVIKKIGKYSFGNYVAGFIGSLPAMFLPLIIINHLNAENAAFYYISMMIANILFIIPQASSNSLFAEGSYNEAELPKQIKKAVRIISLLLLPAILITIFFGNYILLAFGKDYSAEGFQFLQILAISGIFVSINSVFASVLKVQKRLKTILTRSILTSLLIIGLSYYFLTSQPSLGLHGIGYAWLIGQGAASVFYLITSLKKKN
jgi:O-antigen/teichoic acid export membrane protein